jgi:hypothetical protein
MILLFGFRLGRFGCSDGRYSVAYMFDVIGKRAVLENFVLTVDNVIVAVDTTRQTLEW